MTSHGIRGLLWCWTFVILDAAQAVFAGSVLQRVDSLLLGVLVFGISGAACLTWAGLRAPEQLARAFRTHRALTGLNITAAGGWIAYLLAVQMIEPAVAFTMLSGAIPLTTIVAARLGIAEAEPARNTFEAAGNVILAAGLLALAVFTVAGWSGFVRGDVAVAFAGIALSLLSGVLIAAMLLYSQRLDRNGVGPVAQFGLRFPLYVALAGAGVFIGLDDKGAVPASDLLAAVLIGFALLAFPVYAVQKAVSTNSPLTIGAAAAVTPLVVFLLQAIEGRVSYSHATSLGLAIYFAGALVAAIGSVRAVSGGLRAEASRATP